MLEMEFDYNFENSMPSNIWLPILSECKMDGWMDDRYFQQNLFIMDDQMGIERKTAGIRF